jgi:hypothetical protein
VLRVADDIAPLWADREFLREVQYASDGNLAARQSIYAFSEPRLNLSALVLDSLGLTGSEIVLDVGCGNGMYLGRRGQMIAIGLIGEPVPVGSRSGAITHRKAQCPLLWHSGSRSPNCR